MHNSCCQNNCFDVGMITLGYAIAMPAVAPSRHASLDEYPQEAFNIVLTMTLSFLFRQVPTSL